MGDSGGWGTIARRHYLLRGGIGTCFTDPAFIAKLFQPATMQVVPRSRLCAALRRTSCSVALARRCFGGCANRLSICIVAPRCSEIMDGFVFISFCWLAARTCSLDSSLLYLRFHPLHRNFDTTRKLFRVIFRNTRTLSRIS